MNVQRNKVAQQQQQCWKNRMLTKEWRQNLFFRSEDVHSMKLYIDFFVLRDTAMQKLYE